MRVSKQGIAEIFSHEAIVPYKYLDSVGVATFGVGHTVNAGPPDPRKMRFGEEHALSEVIQVFRKDLRKFEDRVSKAVKVPIKQHEFDAMVSFDFNTGAINRASWVKALNAHNRAVAAEMILQWNKPPEIMGRRRKEQALFRSGTYGSHGMATVVPASITGRPLFSQGKKVNVMKTLDLIADANEEDRAADNDRRTTVVVGTGGTATGGTAPTVPETPLIPSDFSKWGLIAVSVILFISAGIFAFRWWAKRYRAKQISDEAAGELAIQLAQKEKENV